MDHKFTCMTCQVAFQDSELHRQHFRTDWHRYNLKRKVAELPPVTAESFQNKVLKQREENELANKKFGTYCKLCRKSFQSIKAFNNHQNSKKHKDNLREGPMELSEVCCPNITTKKSKSKLDSEYVNSIEGYDTDDSEIEEIDSAEWFKETSANNPILNNNCLFCSHHSSTFMKVLYHMSIEHSFFIPDAEYVTDLKGLMLYLGEKVCQGFICLWCNETGKSFHSMEAAQHHMIDKGHCKMLHEGETLMEYADFYDYRSSYPDFFANGYVGDEEVDVNFIEEIDYQLVLPSGATIGHRSLMRYYRQNIDPNRALVPQRKKINNVIAQYKSLGWKETDKAIVNKKAKDLDFMKRVQNKYSMKIGIKANKLQKHFRPQVNF